MTIDLWTLGYWETRVQGSEIVRVSAKRRRSLQSLITTTSTTSHTDRDSVPCSICGCPAHFPVYDYTEVEQDTTAETRERVWLCDFHRRPSLVYRLDGSVRSLHDMRVEFDEQQEPYVEWEGN